jgi:hypothetical protein
MGFLSQDILRQFYLFHVKFEILMHAFLPYFVMEIRQPPFVILRFIFISRFLVFIHTFFSLFVIVFASLIRILFLLSARAHLFNDASFSPEIESVIHTCVFSEPGSVLC